MNLCHIANGYLRDISIQDGLATSDIAASDNPVCPPGTYHADTGAGRYMVHYYSSIHVLSFRTSYLELI